MKKILATAQLLIFSLIVFTQSVGISAFAQNAKSSFSNNSTTSPWNTPTLTTKTINPKTNQVVWETTDNWTFVQNAGGSSNGVGSDQWNQAKWGGIGNSSVTTESNTSTSDTTNKLGINADKKCLTNGQCSFSIYKLLGIRQDTSAEEAVSAPLFAQDVVLAVTFFIGTVVTIALIYSGLMLVFSGYDEKMAQQGKDGIKYALIGLVIVTFSYTIIRLVQYIAKG